MLYQHCINVIQMFCVCSNGSLYVYQTRGHELVVVGTSYVTQSNPCLNNPTLPLYQISIFYTFILPAQWIEGLFFLKFYDVKPISGYDSLCHTNNIIYIV